MHEFNEIFIQILVLLAIGVGVAMISNIFKQPYSVALVVVGVIIGTLPLPVLDHAKSFITHSTVFQVIVISIFLPTLLGEATLKLKYTEVRKYKLPIFSLALGGTFISFLLIGLTAYFLLQLPLPVAFTFAALMSATDPISVLSIFKSLGVPKKLTTIIEGESLINDGIAVVLFMIASTYLLSYMEMGWAGLGEGIVLFFKFALGGLIIGAGFGMVASYIIKTMDDYPFEITISLLVFFGSFFTAELIHVSGVIAVVTAGLIFGNFGGAIGMSDVTKLNINSFWEVIAFIANSLIFLMVGLEINRIDLTGKWGMIGIAILVVIGSRSVAVYSSLFFAKTVPMKFKHILNWGGLKGSLSIALALSLPNDFAGRDDVLVLALSVVLFSLIGQGLTIEPLIKKLDILRDDERIVEYESMVAQMYRYQKAIYTWEEMKNNSFLSDGVFMELKNSYESKRDELQIQLEQLYQECPEIKESQIRRAKRNALYTEYQAVKDLLNREIISNDVGKKNQKELIDKIEDIEFY